MADRSDRQYDYDLVERFKSGDADAFSELYERHKDKVFRVAHRIVQNREDGLDLVQETFVTAHRALHKFERRASVSTWLCQIAVHRAIDQTRKRKLRSSEALGYQTATPSAKVTRGMVASDEPYDPVSAATGAELEDRLQVALDSLTEKHRTVFLLYTLRGLAYKEIARELDISIGTVMSRLYYARQKLQALLVDFAQERNPS